MARRHYKSGENRNQSGLFPPSLDEYVSLNNTVRAIDAYVSTLDLNQLGFQHTEHYFGSGHPCYDPSDLLKLYLYGYINHARSSRRLARETQRNVEVMWLIGQQHPSHQTIADFRKDNPEALRNVNRDFTLLCKELNLFGGKKVAVDGSFFRGNASKASITTESTLKKQLKALDEKIEAYHQELDNNDQLEMQETLSGIEEDPQLDKKLEKLKAKQIEKQQQLKKLQDSDSTQLSTTDSDARLLKKSGQVVVGYNVQSVVDNKHHLVVATEVTNDGNDSQQLYPMLSKAKATLQVKKIIGLADAGYYEGIQLKKCEEDDITVYVPEPDKNKAVKSQGRFTRQSFSYDKEHNIYLCPQGNKLKQQGKAHKKNNKMRNRYSSKAAECNACPLRTKCLTEKGTVRQIYRWEHEDILERHHERMKDSDKAMVQRASLAEHPFGTWKDRAGYTYHFLVRGFKKVRGEWSIMVMGYNFTRVLNIIGLKGFMDYCAQRKENGEKTAT